MAPTNDKQFGMVLVEADDGDEYHPRQRNLGKAQHRKFTGQDQHQSMVVRGERTQTVHGTSRAGVPHSLLVLRWDLQQRTRSRRFKSLTLRAVFQTTRRRGREGSPDVYYDPHVVAVAPSGTYAMVPTPVTVARKRHVETGVDAGVEFGKGSAKYSHELSTSVTATDQIVISGFERNEYDAATAGSVGDPDRCNVAEWRLFENGAARSGLPTSFSTAVLLERRDEDEERFTAAFSVRTEVDWLTDSLARLQRLTGWIPRDDPIIFDPHIDEGGQLSVFKDELDAVSLMDQCKFVMFTKVLGADGQTADAGVKGEGAEKAQEDSEVDGAARVTAQRL